MDPPDSSAKFFAQFLVLVQYVPFNDTLRWCVKTILQYNLTVVYKTNFLKGDERKREAHWYRNI